MKLAFAILLAATLGLNAQTNKIVFDRLLSCSNTVLMVNAEYRCTTGMRVAFLNADGYQMFDVRSINTNALNRIGISVEMLAVNDKNLKEYYRQCAVTLAAQQQAQAEAAREQAERDKQARIAAASVAYRQFQYEPPLGSPSRPIIIEERPRGLDHMGLVP
jgi:hypothetical protein